MAANNPTPGTSLALPFIFGDGNTANAQPRIKAIGPASLTINGSSLSVARVDFQNIGANPCIKATLAAGGAIAIDGCTGSTGNTDVGVDVTGCAGTFFAMGLTIANTVTGTAGDIRLAGPAIEAHTNLTVTNVFDQAGNRVIGTGVRVVDQCVLFTNVDGTVLALGDVMRVSATNSVIRAEADTAAHAAGPLWIAVTTPANNAGGYFVAANASQKWVLHDAAPTLAALSYLSPSTAGLATTTIPPVSGTNQKRRIGLVAKVSGNLGLLTGGAELISVLADGMP